MRSAAQSRSRSAKSHEREGWPDAGPDSEAGQTIHIKAGMTLILEAGMQLSLKGPGGFVDIGPAGVTIQGTMVLINSGGAAGSGPGASPQESRRAQGSRHRRRRYQVHEVVEEDSLCLQQRD